MQTDKVRVFTVAFACLFPGLVFAQQLTWSRIWGSANNDYAIGIARDTHGSLYLTGHTQGSWNGQTNSGGFDAFLTKFDPAGNILWSRIWGSPTNDWVAGVAVDRSNNVYVAGTTLGSFGGQSNTLPPLGDFFVTKWTPEGTHVWTRIWGSTSNDTAAGIVVDRSLNVYVAGHTPGQFGTPGQTNTKLGTLDFCLSSLSGLSGAFQWSYLWGSTNSDYCYGLSIDAYDWMFLAGTTRGRIFVDQTNNFTTVDRLVISAFFEGLPRWHRIWGATNKNNDAYAIYVDPADRVYVAGRTFGAFDGQPFQTNAFSYPDFFVTCFDSGNRTLLWTRIRGSMSLEEAYAVWSDGTGSVYVGGITDGNFDGQVRAGGSDFMLVKYNADGAHQWTRFAGSASDDEPIKGLTLDAAGNVFACGSTYGSFGGQTNPGEDSAVLMRWRMTPNTAPTAILVRPLPMREFLENEQILCIGSANDDDDGALTNLVWSIGTNSTFTYGSTCYLTAAVSPGQQTVQLRAMDTEGATGTAEVVVQVLERSGDGLPVSWQTHYWPEGGSGGSSGDPDGDGVDNYTEWLTGTNPTNAGSYFRCTLTPLLGNALLLQWPSVSNLSYAIYAAPDMQTGVFTEIAAPWPTPPVNSFTANVDSASTRFFQLRAER